MSALELVVGLGVGAGAAVLHLRLVDRAVSRATRTRNPGVLASVPRVLVPAAVLAATAQVGALALVAALLAFGAAGRWTLRVRAMESAR